jgi:hypothetical protein
LEHDDDLAQPWTEVSDKGKAPAGASTMHGEPHDLLDLDRVGTSDGEEGLERFGDLDGYACPLQIHCAGADSYQRDARECESN